MIAQIDFTLTGAILRFPYDRLMVDTIKQVVPPRSRAWRPEGKYWTVDHPFAERMVVLLRQRFGDVLIDGEAVTTTPIRGTDRDFAELHLLPSAPPDLVQVVYRHLAKRHHPDTGGDTATMQRLNDAYSALRDRGAA